VWENQIDKKERFSLTNILASAARRPPC
jgi:hypothetical protein